MRQFVKEPLLHFLMLGAGIFLLYGAFAPKESATSSSTIVVERDDLLTFMQYRAKSFDRQRFGTVLDALSREERQRLIDDYVREEALYREAKALELDNNDYVSRRRLIQSLEFITQGILQANDTITEQTIRAYYDAHAIDYREPAKITFTHVFINGDNRGWDEAKQVADQTLIQLNRDQVPFHEAVSHGDRFLYHTNYVGKEADLIASHFGKPMQQQLFAQADDSPQNHDWVGVFRSPYGYHVALVTQVSEATLPAFDTVQDRVFQDVQRIARETAINEALAAIVDTYRVEVAPSLTRAPDSVAPLPPNPEAGS